MNDDDEEFKQLIASNAKAIQALTNAAVKKRKERQRSELCLNAAMARIFEAIAQIGSAQASFWEVQADYYRRLEETDYHQAQILEILNRLSQSDQ